MRHQRTCGIGDTLAYLVGTCQIFQVTYDKAGVDLLLQLLQQHRNLQCTLSFFRQTAGLDRQHPLSAGHLSGIHHCYVIKGSRCLSRHKISTSLDLRGG